MDFPITVLMDEQAVLDDWLDRLAAPGLSGLPALPSTRPPRRPLPGRDPVLDFRCRHYGRVFNASTDTALHGLRRRPGVLILMTI